MCILDIFALDFPFSSCPSINFYTLRIFFCYGNICITVTKKEGSGAKSKEIKIMMIITMSATTETKTTSTTMYTSRGSLTHLLCAHTFCAIYIILVKLTHERMHVENRPKWSGFKITIFSDHKMAEIWQSTFEFAHQYSHPEIILSLSHSILISLFVSRITFELKQNNKKKML